LWDGAAIVQSSKIWKRKEINFNFNLNSNKLNRNSLSLSLSLDILATTNCPK
jgi:hypothetical protein